ncbi:MAG: MaoC family dehydratase [Candidatus Kaiserbacteria bacterium]|nr:MaoC family dehydratase [Candidatus Kaiserbacteria bacterium]
MAAEKTFAEIREGDTVQFTVVIDETVVQKFADFSGDFNPLHMDVEFAQKTSLGKRVAHGMLGGIFFSRLVGMHLPGLHSLYLSQSLFFRKPIYLGTTVVVSGVILQKIESMKTVKMATEIRDEETGEILVDGEAMVKVLL